MKEAQAQQKSYADNRRKSLEFLVGDLVFVRISPINGVIRFSQSGKLAPRYIGLFPIIEHIRSVAYRLTLPAQFSSIHNVFHVSQLRKCIRDPESVLEPNIVEDIDISPNLTYEQQPLQIVATEVKRLRNKNVPLVKVQRSANPKDCLWETKESIKRTHPDLLSYAS